MQTLRDAALLFLAKAREELEEGVIQNNAVLIRDAAEKAWNAVVQATDHFMGAPTGATSCLAGTPTGTAATS